MSESIVKLAMADTEEVLAKFKAEHTAEEVAAMEAHEDRPISLDVFEGMCHFIDMVRKGVEARNEDDKALLQNMFDHGVDHFNKLSRVERITAIRMAKEVADQYQARRQAEKDGILALLQQIIGGGKQGTGEDKMGECSGHCDHCSTHKSPKPVGTA